MIYEIVALILGGFLALMKFYLGITPEMSSFYIVFGFFVLIAYFVYIFERENCEVLE